VPADGLHQLVGRDPFDPGNSSCRIRAYRQAGSDSPTSATGPSVSRRDPIASQTSFTRFGSSERTILSVATPAAGNPCEVRILIRYRPRRRR
jgi:hypothetical protein